MGASPMHSRRPAALRFEEPLARRAAWASAHATVRSSPMKRSITLCRCSFVVLNVAPPMHRRKASPRSSTARTSPAGKSPRATTATGRSSTASSTTTRSREAKKRQEPLDREGVRRLRPPRRLADQGDAVHQPATSRTSCPTARTRTGRRRQGAQAGAARLRLRHHPPRRREEPGEHLVLADRLGRDLRLPHGPERCRRR